MNFPRVALAAVTAWVAYLGIGVVVNTFLLADLATAPATLLRPDRAARVPLGLGSGLLGFFAFAYMYAKGYEGGYGRQEGLRFGVLVGLLLVCFSTVWVYLMFPISATLAVAWAIDRLVEMAVYGMIVGSIYRPLPQRPRRAAAVAA